MKHRVLGILAALAVLPVVVSAAPARAFDPFTGRVVDSVTSAPLAGVTVQLTDTAGVAIAGLTAVTAANGKFSVPALDEEHGVFLDGSAIGYEVGYLGCLDVVATWLDACSHAPSDLGVIALDRRSFDGRVVDSLTRRPVGGVTVQVTDTSGLPVPGYATTTAPNGRFRVAAPSEEHGLRFDGSAVSYEAGYLRLIDRTVVDDWDAVGTLSPRSVGIVLLDPIGPGPVRKLVLTSTGTRQITATFVAPPTGALATWYELTCNGVMRRYGTTGETRGGFLPGPNQCVMVARNRAGVSPPVGAFVVVLAAGRR